MAGKKKKGREERLGWKGIETEGEKRIGRCDLEADSAGGGREVKKAGVGTGGGGAGGGGMQ